MNLESLNESVLPLQWDVIDAAKLSKVLRMTKYVAWEKKRKEKNLRNHANNNESSMDCQSIQT